MDHDRLEVAVRRLRRVLVVKLYAKHGLTELGVFALVAAVVILLLDYQASIGLVLGASVLFIHDWTWTSSRKRRKYGRGR